MSEEKSPSGTPDKVSDEVETKTQVEDKVSYETYRRVLSEKKKAQERLDLLEKASKEREENELKEKEKWKDYASLKEKEALEFKSKYESEIKDRTDMVKLSTVLENIDGTVPRKVWDKINIDKIVVDPSTNMPDPLSVQQVVKEFLAEWPEVIQKRSGPKTSQDAPNSTGTLSYEEWKNLPLAEMRKRYAEVRQTEKLKGV